MKIMKKINIADYDLYFFLKDYFDKTDNIDNQYLITLYETLKVKLTKDEENSISVKYYEELVYIDGKKIMNEYNFKKENLADILYHKSERLDNLSLDITKLLRKAYLEQSKLKEPADRKNVDLADYNFYKEIER